MSLFCTQEGTSSLIYKMSLTTNDRTTENRWTNYEKNTDDSNAYMTNNNDNNNEMTSNT